LALKINEKNVTKINFRGKGGKYEKETVSKIKFQIRQRPSGGTVVVSKSY